MPSSPLPPDVLPSLEHNGTSITVLRHHGFSTPERGPLPKSRILYGAFDQQKERHWRSSLKAIQQLIDGNFRVAPSPGVEL